MDLELLRKGTPGLPTQKEQKIAHLPLPFPTRTVFRRLCPPEIYGCQKEVVPQLIPKLQAPPEDTAWERDFTSHLWGES